MTQLNDRPTQAGTPTPQVSYDTRQVGRPILALTPDDYELELDVRAAQARVRSGATLEELETAARHVRVVQIATLLPDGTQVWLDLTSGEARSLAAMLTVAADRQDGVS